MASVISLLSTAIGRVFDCTKRTPPPVVDLPSLVGQNNWTLGEALAFKADRLIETTLQQLGPEKFLKQHPCSSPLHLALIYQRKRVFKLFLNAFKPNILCERINGTTPLQYAFQYNNRKESLLLVQRLGIGTLVEELDVLNSVEHLNVDLRDELKIAILKRLIGEGPFTDTDAPPAQKPAPIPYNPNEKIWSLDNAIVQGRYTEIRVKLEKLGPKNFLLKYQQDCPDPLGHAIDCEQYKIYLLFVESFDSETCSTEDSFQNLWAELLWIKLINGYSTAIRVYCTKEGYTAQDLLLPLIKKLNRKALLSALSFLEAMVIPYIPYNKLVRSSKIAILSRLAEPVIQKHKAKKTFLMGLIA